MINPSNLLGAITCDIDNFRAPHKTLHRRNWRCGETMAEAVLWSTLIIKVLLMLLPKIEHDMESEIKELKGGCHG